MKRLYGKLIFEAVFFFVLLFVLETNILWSGKPALQDSTIVSLMNELLLKVYFKPSGEIISMKSTT